MDPTPDLTQGQIREAPQNSYRALRAISNSPPSAPELRSLTTWKSVFMRRAYATNSLDSHGRRDRDRGAWWRADHERQWSREQRTRTGETVQRGHRGRRLRHSDS